VLVLRFDAQKAAASTIDVLPAAKQERVPPDGNTLPFMTFSRLGVLLSLDGVIFAAGADLE